MASDSMRLIQALVRAGSKETSRDGSDIPHGPVVTVSRQYGSGGKAVATALADELGVRCFDREILDAVVEDAKVDRYLMEELDERVRGSLSDWVYTLLTGKSVFAEDYRRHLVNVVVAIADRGGVILGRGAHLILADRPNVLRVQLVASLEQRIKRVAKREGISEDAAHERVREVEHQRDVFLHALYRRREVLASDFDITICTDRISTDDSVSLILQAMAKRGIVAAR